MREINQARKPLALSDESALRDNAFNALRFFCCVVVIIAHAFDGIEACGGAPAFLDAHICVCMFFILSGFWVTRSFLLTDNTRAWAIKRVKRLLPLYYTSVIVFAVICVFYSDLTPSSYFTSRGFWRYLFWNGLCLNFVCPTLPGVFPLSRGGVFRG